MGTGEFELDTATDGSVKAIRGVGMAEFPDVGVFGEMLKTFVWNKIKSHIEYQPGQYYLDTYHTELPLAPDVWYLHFKPFDESSGSFYELKQKLNSLAYHFADFYIDPLDPAILMKADISMPDDPLSSNTPGFAGTFLNHVTQGLNDNNPISFKAMIGLSNQGKFMSKSYDFQMINKAFFKSKYGISGFESASSNYFVKMDEPGIPVPYTDGMMNIVGEQYLHQPAIMTKIGDFSQPGLIDYLNNTYKGGYMMDFSGKLRFGGNEYFSALLNGLGAINDVVGKDVFNTDLDLDLAHATLQIQVPGTVEGLNDVPSYFRFGGMTKLPLATEIFGEEIRKYIPVFPPPATEQFFYVSAGPTKDDCSIFLEGGAKVHVPAFGDLDLGNAYFYVSLDGIEMGGTSKVDAGPFHVDGDMKGTLSKQGFNLKMKSNGAFTLNNIKFADSHLDMTASSDSGLTFNGDITLPYGLGNANVKGKFVNQKVTFAGELKAGTELSLPNGLKLPTAEMKFSFDETNGLVLSGKVSVPKFGWISVEGKVSGSDFSLKGNLSAGGITFGSTKVFDVEIAGPTLPYADATISISRSNGVQFSGNFQLVPLGKVRLSGNVNSESLELGASGSISFPINGNYFNIAECQITASTARFKGISISGNMNLYFVKVDVSGYYYATGFNITGSTTLTSGTLKVNLTATVNASNLTLKATGSLAGVEVGVRITPDWSKGTLKVCYNTTPISEKCVTF